MPAPSLRVRNYMSKQFASIRESQSVEEAVKLLSERNSYGAAVLDQLGNMVGVISVTDCIDAAIKHGFTPGWGGTVRDLMTTDVRYVEMDDNILDVAKMFMDEPYRRYPVMDDNRVVGVVSRLDVVKALHKINKSGVAV
ncbi:MAG: CBS domain-containing protein [Thiothrix sp.]|nr:CBS domain-containing protein [Thiothrix sp.]HPE60005.1 CBS domain-containing protein [Thiolinea sp.]